MRVSIIAAVLAVARAVLHEDVVRAGSHQTKALVSLDSRLAHVRTTAEVPPDTVNWKKTKQQPVNYSWLRSN